MHRHLVETITCAASTRPWSAIMPSSSVDQHRVVKPNSRIEAAICATCWFAVRAPRFWRRGSAPRTGAEQSSRVM